MTLAPPLGLLAAGTGGEENTLYITWSPSCFREDVHGNAIGAILDQTSAFGNRKGDFAYCCVTSPVINAQAGVPFSPDLTSAPTVVIYNSSGAALVLVWNVWMMATKLDGSQDIYGQSDFPPGHTITVPKHGDLYPPLTLTDKQFKHGTDLTLAANGQITSAAGGLFVASFSAYCQIPSRSPV